MSVDSRENLQASPRPSFRPSYGEGRSALIEATVAVVAEQGIARLSQRAVAARAGVSHGLIRHYFGSLGQLIGAALESIYETSRILHPVTMLLDDREGAEQHLLDWLRDRRQLHAFEYEVLLASRHDARLNEASRKLYAAYRRSLRETFAAHGVTDPGDEQVELVMACLIGIEVQAATITGADDPQLLQAMAGLRSAVIGAASSA